MISIAPGRERISLSIVQSERQVIARFNTKPQARFYIERAGVSARENAIAKMDVNRQRGFHARCRPDQFRPFTDLPIRTSMLVSIDVYKLRRDHMHVGAVERLQFHRRLENDRRGRRCVGESHTCHEKNREEPPQTRHAAQSCGGVANAQVAAGHRFAERL